jgi:hypothetical protein
MSGKLLSAKKSEQAIRISSLQGFWITFYFIFRSNVGDAIDFIILRKFSGIFWHRPAFSGIVRHRPASSLFPHGFGKLSRA